MNKPKRSQLFRINHGFIVQKVGEKVVIFDGEKSLLFSLNGSASKLFRKIQVGWDKERLVDFLVEKYSLRKDQAEKDVEEFLQELLKRKIIF